MNEEVDGRVGTVRAPARLQRTLTRLTPAFVIGLVLMVGVPALGAEVQVPDPERDDTCPVCGMFVDRYPEWTATVLYADGHVHHFDGAKDLFKYLFDMPTYAPGERREDIAIIAVTEYYGLKRIDAREAFYVIGSDVVGPMGHELVPLETQADAEEFLADHRGVRILRFEEVDPELLERLDRGRFQ